MEDITVKPDTTFVELQQAGTQWREVYYWSPATKIALWGLLVLGVCALAFSVAQTWGSTASAAGAIALVAFSLYYFMSSYVGNEYRRKVHRRMNAASAVYTFSSTGIRYTADGMQGELSWKSLDSVLENAEFYLLTRGNSCICIPKRNIPADRLEDFDSLVHARSD